MSPKLSRRSLLTAAALAPLVRAAKYSPVFAGQAFVWTQHYGRLGQKTNEHYGDILAGFASAGFKNVELMSDWFSPDFAERTAGLLKQNKLACPVCYNGGPMHTADGSEKTIASTLDLARRIRKVNPGLAAISFNANPLPQRAAKTDAELAIQAKSLTRLGDELAREKLRFLVHQHDPEMLNKAREWRHILANTNPRTVEVCLDTHWVFRGGEDVMTHLKEAAPRLAALHLRNSKDKIWLEEFGAGDIDYAQVADFLKSIGYRGYLTVELAYDKETRISQPIETSLKRSLEYAKKVFA
jgi:sugar phosphate isomerase/epimerase